MSRSVLDATDSDYLRPQEGKHTLPALAAHKLAALQPVHGGFGGQHTLPVFSHGSQDDMTASHDGGFIQARLPGGSGSGTIQDTSPTMASETAFINGIDATGHTVATSFWTWNNNNPATFASRSDDHKWGGSASGSAGGTVNYYFDTASSWTATEKAQMTACITLWSDIANIHFALTTNAAAADITFHRGNDGSAVTPAGWSGTSSAGVVGGSTLWTMTDATVSIDTSVPGFGPMDGTFTSIGGYVWETILHELGHAIGLGHGGAYNGNVDSGTQQYSAFDSRLWSIMSYIDPDDDTAKYFSQYTVTGTSWGTATDGYGNVATTPMVLDIMAIQQLYGASTSAAYSGGQVFGFNCNIADATEPFYDFTKNVNPVVTLWDSGTGNTLDLSGWHTASTIDLNPGDFSSGNGQVNNIGIAFGTHIDKAIGGTGNDTFIANTDADLMIGGAGLDTFQFFGNFTADDSINGGGGNNKLLLDGDYSVGVNMKNTTMINVPNIIMAAGHTYVFVPSTRVVSAGATVNVDASALGSTNTLTWNGVKETDGHYHILGGAGVDVLVGGSLSDTIDGGAGGDHIKGGPGGDTFVYSAVANSTSTKHDLIFDFDAASDKIDIPFAIGGTATKTTGSLSSTTLDADLATAATGLASHHALFFTPNAGNLAGHTFLIVDYNGVAGYQKNADLVIDLEQPTHPASFGTGIFV